MYPAYGIDMKNSDALWSTTAAVVRLSNDFYEYVQLGDSMVLAFCTDDKYEILTRDQLLPWDSLTLKKWKDGIKIGLRTQKELWDHVLPLLRDHRYKANVKDGYGAINGQVVLDELICYGKCPTNNVKSIALLTDGLGIPTNNPSKYVNWNKTAKVLKDGGLDSLLGYIRKIEESDPECLKYPRYKKSDDATGVMVFL
jgi:hypothetical protein